MKIDKTYLLSRGFIEIPSPFSMETLQKGGVKLCKRIDLNRWKCYVSDGWYVIKTQDQLDLILQIVNNE